MFSKEDLFKTKLKRKIVSVPGGSLVIREFTTADREQFEKLALKKEVAPNFKAKLIVLSVINEDASRFFGDDDIDKISQLPSSLTESIFKEILKLNAMNPKAVEEEEGN